MAYRIDDEENRYQDLKDKVDQIEIQTFSPEVVARNESTRNTGIETGSGASTNPYPLWYPIRNFGTLGSITLDVLENRTDSHVNKLTANGDIDFAFSLPPGTNKMMWFILDVTVDATGGYTFNLLNNILPAGISIDSTANSRTVLRFTTTDGGVTYYAENLTTGGGGGTNLLPLNNTWTGTNTHTALSTFKAGLQLSDASDNIHGLFQGIVSIGTRLTLTSGEKFQIFDNITNILEINSAFGVNVKTLDIRNVDRLQLSGGTSSVTSVNDVVWYLNASGDLISNVNASDGWIWSSANVTKMLLTDSTLEKRNVTAPNFNLYNTRAAATGTAGIININANSASITTGISMASIIGDTEDITGNGIGSMKLAVNLSGVSTSFITLNDSNDGVVKLLKNLELDTNNISGVGNLIFTGISSLINMNGGDITGFDTLQANGSTSEILMVGGFIDMGDGEIRDADDITMHGNSKILSVGSTEFGIQVDNAAATVGSAGMVAIPVANLTTVLTKAILDAAFGNHKGAMGFDTNTLINSRLWIRESNGNWRGFDYDASVTS